MSKMEKNISFQVFALPHTSKKAEKSPENGLPPVSQKRIFPAMPKRFSGCAIQEPDYNDLVQVRCNCTFSGSHWAGFLFFNIRDFQCGIPGSADAVYLEEHGLLTTLKSGEPSFIHCRTFCFNLAIFQNNPERAW